MDPEEEKAALCTIWFERVVFAIAELSSSSGPLDGPLPVLVPCTDERRLRLAFSLAQALAKRHAGLHGSAWSVEDAPLLPCFATDGSSSSSSSSSSSALVLPVVPHRSAPLPHVIVVAVTKDSRCVWRHSSL